MVEVNRGQYSIFREVEQDTGAGYFTVLSRKTNHQLYVPGGEHVLLVGQQLTIVVIICYSVNYTLKSTNDMHVKNVLIIEEE